MTDHILDEKDWLHLRVARLYKELCKQPRPGTTIVGMYVQYRVGLVEQLEKLLHTDFYNAQDLHQKISAFLNKETKWHIKLKNYRREKGYSSRVMADILGISRRHYSRMENGHNPLNQKALELLS